MLLDIQIATSLEPLPDKALLQKWVEKALDVQNQAAEIILRIVDEAEGKALNKTWQKKDSATNVLSFPIGETLAVLPNLLGDIVICAPIVEREAEVQGKQSDAHWAHLVTHGVLHLQGYDHQNQEQAHLMETKEIAILKSHCYPNPYHSETGRSSC